MQPGHPFAVHERAPTMNSRNGAQLVKEDMSSHQTPSLLDLPNEVLHLLLYSSLTKELLRLRTINHRFCHIIGRILHERLLKTLCLRDWKLIIECYHPSRQRFESYNFCEYVGISGIDLQIANSQVSQGRGYDPGWLRDVLARFRPSTRIPERPFGRLHRAGDIPGSRTMDEVQGPEQKSDDPVKRFISLESHENFSQLIFSASFVQLGPATGIFNALAEIIDKKTIRLFRKELSRKAQDRKEKQAPDFDEAEPESLERSEKLPDHLLWINDSKAVGLKINVEEGRWKKHTPILFRAEDEAVKYSVELAEIHVSLLHLLLALERTVMESDRTCSNAVVFGSFPDPGN